MGMNCVIYKMESCRGSYQVQLDICSFSTGKTPRLGWGLLNVQSSYHSQPNGNREYSNNYLIKVNLNYLSDCLHFFLQYFLKNCVNSIDI